ncbi:MAG: hypothetical protein KGJ35_01690, partial [Patescibacteria group bacterium]|nr:hypothetical protein [Patescibacteria group bacterium]
LSGIDQIKKELGNDNDPVATIQKIVSEVWGIHVWEMLKYNNEARVTVPRKAGMYLACCYQSGSTQYIAERFNRTDHSTVVYACRTCRNLLETKDLVFTEKFNLSKRTLDKIFFPKEIYCLDYQI